MTIVHRRLPFLTLVTLLALAVAPAWHPAMAPAGDASGETGRAERLDRLHVALLGAPDAFVAAEIADEIWTIWFTAPDSEAQVMLDAARQSLRYGDYERSVTILDTVVERWPDYAEGWNQRATVRFLQERYEASLADVDRVLVLEPRHFGALAGRALIYFRQERRDAANRAILAALRVHPWLAERGLLDPAYEEAPL
ncbi:MAG: hypothetical protein AAFR52_05530 [Pseudomonadota bacterium]